MNWWVKSLGAGVVASAGCLAVGYVIGRMFQPVDWELAAILTLAVVAVVFAFGSLPTRQSPTPPRGFSDASRHSGISHMAWQVAYRSGSGESGARRWSPDLLIAALPPAIGAVILASIFVSGG